ncbi:ribonuclease H-like domain-containing protein [Tanacetum coccineum]
MVDGDKPPNDKRQASDPEGSNIDQYDPLFLHSNDTSRVPLITFKLEGTKNYKVWKATITIAIHTKNKLGFINGKLARPTEEGFKQEQRDRCNYVVLNWILGCVSQDVLMSQVFSKNAKVEMLSIHHLIGTIKVNLDLLLKEAKNPGSLSPIGQASDPEGSNIDQYDPLFLHSNDTSRVPLITFKLEGTKNYKVWKATITIAIHTKNKLGFINGKLARPTEEGFKQEQRDRCNYVVLNWILGCVSQDVFMSQVFSKNAKVEMLSIILTTDPNPNVKRGFATLSRDESNRGSQSHIASKPGNSAFVDRPNTRNNNWTSNNNQPRKLNRPNLVCTHCNMNDHTADRDQSTSNSFTDDQYKRLMALISDKLVLAVCLQILQVSKLNMTVGHPNHTKVVVTHVGSLSLTNKIVIYDVFVVPGYEVILLSVYKLSKDNKFRVLYDEDVCVIQDSVQKI